MEKGRFIPYRCEDCIYGIYNHEDSCYENGCFASDDEECRELFRKVTGVPYQALPGTDIFDVSVLPEGCDIRKVSLAFGRAMREAGYRIIYTARRIDLQPCDMT